MISTTYSERLTHALLLAVIVLLTRDHDHELWATFHPIVIFTLAFAWAYWWPKLMQGPKSQDHTST